MRCFALLFALSIALPAADVFKYGGELRGRWEGFTGIGFAPGNDDFYYLHRLRIFGQYSPSSWFRIYGMAQDSHAPGFKPPAPVNVANTFDLFQAYLEFGGEKSGWSLRAGRQQMSFGEERLVGFSNWGNSSRSWDGARLTYQAKGFRLDWFSAAAVPQRKDLFDKPARDNKLHGFYPSFQNWIKGSTFEPYFLVKQSRNILAYTYGFRAIGKLPARFDYSSDTVGQAGANGADPIRAWAGHWVLGHKAGEARLAPRLLVEYNQGSGDKNAKDGKFGTFDQLYPTNHSKYGTADRISWRNSRDLMAGSEWIPRKAWRVLVDYHQYNLVTTQDALYTEAGAVFVRNLKATSTDVGREIDVQATYRRGAHLLFAGGVGHFWPGRFLKESSKGSPVTAPYLSWSFLF